MRPKQHERKTGHRTKYYVNSISRCNVVYARLRRLEFYLRNDARMDPILLFVSKYVNTDF